MGQDERASRCRVAIVGAGVAGLSAANALIASGKFAASDVRVLEGAVHIGGRVQTRPFSDELSMNVELGAAWIHGTQGNPFAALATKFGIEWKEVAPRNPSLHPGSCPNFCIYDGQSRLTEQEVKETWEWQELLMQKLNALATSKDSAASGQPLSKVIDMLVESDPELHPLVSSASNGRKRLDYCVHKMETYLGATADELQIDDFVGIDTIGDSPGPHCIIPNGMQRFVEGLAKPVSDCISTSTRVLEIDYSDEANIKITTSSGKTIEADFVVVTSSLGYLKTNQLQFVPDLPAVKKDAIARCGMGLYMKVLLQFPSVFWPKDAVFIGQIDPETTSGQGSEDQKKRLYFPTLMNYHAMKNAPVLEAQLVGDLAVQAVSTMTEGEIVNAMHLQLQDTFGRDIPAPVGHFITRWDQNEWSHGAFSCLTTSCTLDDPEILRQNVANRVFFAGEATNYEFQGCLQAAYITGAQAAEEIIALL